MKATNWFYSQSFNGRLDVRRTIDEPDYLVRLMNAYWYLLDNYDGCGTEQRAADIIRNVIRKSVPNFLG